MSAPSTTGQVAALNDRLRTSLGFITGSGLMVMTRGISELETDLQISVLSKVRTFGSFTADNDPYGEHDFGAVTVDGVGKVFWKIDYYADDRCECGSEDPADPEKSFRVMTIMLASEY